MKKDNNLTDIEKITLTYSAFKDFEQSLDGPYDIYKKILLEELFRLLMNEKSDNNIND